MMPASAVLRSMFTLSDHTGPAPGDTPIVLPASSDRREGLWQRSPIA